MKTIEVNSLERLVPDDIRGQCLQGQDTLGQETLALHVARYRFAAEHVRGKRILDCACGVGYGTALMADALSGLDPELIGVDIADDAIAYAKQHYGRPHVQFIVGDGRHLCLEPAFDTIVSLETIEHLADCETLVDGFFRLLKPGGHLIASVPYTPSVDGNPHHKRDFSLTSYRQLFERHDMRKVAELHQTQPFTLRETIGSKQGEGRSRDIRRHLVSYYLQHPFAFMRRIASTVQYGLTNRYITAVWEKQ